MAVALGSLRRTWRILGPGKCYLIKGQISLHIHIANMTQSTPRLANEFVLRPAGQKHSKTLVLMYGYYGATHKAFQKYGNIYHTYGYDVLPIKSHLKHFAWPKCSNALADQTLNFLEQNCPDYDNYLVHAFSMGAYNFTVCLETMYKDQKIYGGIQNKICGVVYDSLSIGSLEGMIQGVASGVSGNQLVRWMIPKTMNIYYYLTHRHTVAVYDYYLDIAKNSPLQVPTLVFYCKNDLLSRHDVIDLWIREWGEKFSFPIFGKLWTKSRHAAHLMTHKEEYLETLDKYLKSVPCLAKDMKVPSKM